MKALKEGLKRYAQSDKGKTAHARAYKKWSKTETGKEYIRTNAKRHYYKNREKYKAVRRINEAVKRGDVVPVKDCICIICRKKTAQNYHHADYSRPLFVFPVCLSCHRYIHKLLK
jgi:hypothetical protein